MTIVKLKSKKQMTKKELIGFYIRNSTCVVSYNVDEFHTWIEFHGAVAQIPSLKNSKPLWGGIAKDTEAKLVAMDKLFLDAKPAGLIVYGPVPVHVNIIIGRKSYKADRIAIGETIQDWLEPASKIVGRKTPKNRGWGVGLIQDDNQVIGGKPLHGADINMMIDHCVISIRPWARCKEAVVHYIAETI